MGKLKFIKKKEKEKLDLKRKKTWLFESQKRLSITFMYLPMLF